MQYDQFDPRTMTPTELRIQFASIRVDLKRTESELAELKRKSESTPWKKMLLAGGMSLLIAANSI